MKWKMLKKMVPWLSLKMFKTRQHSNTHFHWRKLWLTSLLIVLCVDVANCESLMNLPTTFLLFSQAHQIQQKLWQAGKRETKQEFRKESETNTDLVSHGWEGKPHNQLLRGQKINFVSNRIGSKLWIQSSKAQHSLLVLYRVFFDCSSPKND